MNVPLKDDECERACVCTRDCVRSILLPFLFGIASECAALINLQASLLMHKK